MIRIFVAVFVVLAFANCCMAGPPPDDMVKKMTETIQKHCPDAAIEVAANGFVAKHGTMIYTLHGRSKTGEVYAQTYEQEGPNYKGFILSVALYDGGYGGAAMVPNTLQGPYFPTFIDAVAVEDGKRHYQIHFSYGSRLDRELMKAIFDVIPRSKLQQAAGSSAF